MTTPNQEREQDRDQNEEWFKVVGNQRGHISIWPQARENPLGWVDAGFSGTRQSCLDHIDGHVSELTSRVTSAFRG